MILRKYAKTFQRQTCTIKTPQQTHYLVPIAHKDEERTKLLSNQILFMKQTNAKGEKNGLASHVSMALHISAWTTVLVQDLYGFAIDMMHTSIFFF